MKIWAHTLVKNEERYLWFAVTSIIQYVDKVLLWDTGSTDDTPGIIRQLKKIYSEKISFSEVGSVTIDEFTKVRQEMLSVSLADWIIILDGDEVWWDERIAQLTSLINSQTDLETVVSRYINIVGDIYHCQDESAGNYVIDSVRGNLTIRAMNRNIPGLTIAKPHGQQGYYDKDGTLIQHRDRSKRMHTEKPGFLHFTHMIRSGAYQKEKDVPKRKLKYKYEIGNNLPLDFYYPEAFFKFKPEIVQSPWAAMPRGYRIRAGIETPFRKFNRQFIYHKSGY